MLCKGCARAESARGAEGQLGEQQEGKEEREEGERLRLRPKGKVDSYDGMRIKHNSESPNAPCMRLQYTLSGGLLAGIKRRQSASLIPKPKRPDRSQTKPVQKQL
jgi:hypothetical protein